METLVIYIISAILILVAFGFLLKSLGLTNSVGEGTKKIVIWLRNLMVEDTPQKKEETTPANPTYCCIPIEPRDALSFKMGIRKPYSFDDVTHNDKLQRVTFICRMDDESVTDNEYELIEAEFRNYVMMRNNMNIQCKPYVFARYFNNRIEIFLALNEEGKNWVEEQHANRFSRENKRIVVDELSE